MESWRDGRGELHRDHDLPAVVHGNGYKAWYIHGQPHRDRGLPACIYPNGSKVWFEHGKRHRGGGLPAVDFRNGERYWYVRGVPHRDGGLPAIEGNGERYWYFEGYLVTKAFAQKIASRQQEALERALRLVKYHYLLPRLYHPYGERARKEAEETLSFILSS